MNLSYLNRYTIYRDKNIIEMTRFILPYSIDTKKIQRVPNIQNAKGIKASFLEIISDLLGENLMTIESIKAMLNIAAPQREPRGIKATDYEELDPATIVVIISGAPLANARKVTPANPCDISSQIQIYSVYI